MCLYWEIKSPSAVIKTFSKCICEKCFVWLRLTLHQEEEAQDPSGRDDEARHDEGHSPLWGDVDASDEGTDDVSHRGVRVPHTHDEAAPEDDQKYAFAW